MLRILIPKCYRLLLSNQGVTSLDNPLISSNTIAQKDYVNYAYPIKRNGGYYLFYDLTGEFFEISKTDYEHVVTCKQNRNEKLPEDLITLFGEIYIPQIADNISQTIPKLRLEISHVCNNNCAYCHVFKIAKEKGKPDFLSYKKVCQFIRDFLDLVRINSKSDSVLINFYGGEPLLNWQVIKRLLKEFGNFHQGIKIAWIINTNGRLLNKKILKELETYNVGLHMGCDGSADVNDKLRVSNKGKGTFDEIMRGFSLATQYGLQRQIDAVISKTNMYKLHDLIDVARNQSIPSIYLDLLYKPNKLLNIKEMVGVYKDAVAYGEVQCVQVGGVPTNIIRRIQKKSLHQNVNKHVLFNSITVSVDSKIYHTLSSLNPVNTTSIKDYFTENNQNWAEDFYQKNKDFSLTCGDCFLKRYCCFSGILQYQYHTRLKNGFEDYCSFLKEYVLSVLIDDEYQKKKSYQVSVYYRAVHDKKSGKSLAYHALFGNALIINKGMSEILNSLQGNTFDVSQFHFPGLIEKKILTNASEEENLIKRIHSKRPEQKINHLRLNISEQCNMNCRYCYVSNNGGFMSSKIANKAVDVFLKLLKRGLGKGSITIFGGEPLLNKKVLREVIQHAGKTDLFNRHIDNISIVTNGVLLDKNIIQFFKDHHIQVSISLDGPQEAHDLIRIGKDGKGTFKKVERNIHMMISMGYPPDLVCTVGPHNIDFLNELVFMASKWKLYLTINHAFARNGSVSPDFSDAKLADKLFAAFVCAQELDVRLQGTWTRPYQRLFTNNVRLSHCAGAGEELSVDHNGYIRPCPGVTENYGHIDDIEAAIASSVYQKYDMRAAPNITDCNGCDIEGLCGGGCMLNISKIHKENIMKKSESCYLFKTLFKRMVQWHLHKH